MTISLSTALSALCGCLISLIFGISLGRSWGLAEAKVQQPPLKLDPQSERKRVIKSKIPHSQSEPYVGNLQSASASTLHSPAPLGADVSEDDTQVVFETAESAKTALLSILDVNSNASKSKGDVTMRNWKLARTGYSSHMWVSKHKTANILIKGTCFSTMSVVSVAKYLYQNSIWTGLEGIVSQKVELQSMRRNRVVVSRLCCNTGTITSSKREFLVVTYWAEMENGSVIVCTRSLPDSYTPPTSCVGRAQGNASTTNRKKSLVRGFIHSCGFVVLPNQVAVASSGISEAPPKRGCQVLFSANLDMGGSGMSLRRVHASKADAIISYVLDLMDQIHHSLPGIDTTNLDSIPPSPGTVLDIAMGGESQAPIGESVVMGLTIDQRNDLRKISKDCINRLHLMHASACSVNLSQRTISSDASDLGADKKWTTFYDQDGIAISEYCGTDSPVGTLMASCHIAAPPHIVRKLLVEFPEYVDTLLEQKSVLSNIDEHSSVQWIAYSPIWPLGATDFLVVTTEASFDSAQPGVVNPMLVHDSFMIASASADSVCEDELEASSTDNCAAESKYNRSELRLAGYTGVPNSSVGGTDLRLFVDVDAARYVPAWLLQILAQYGLSEMMNRIRVAAPSLASSSFSGLSPMFRPTPSKLGSMLTQIQTREERMRQHFEEHGEVGPRRRHSDSSGSDDSYRRSPAATRAPSADAPESPLRMAQVQTTVNANQERGLVVANESQRLIQVYLGYISDEKYVFEWQHKVKKDNIDVSVTPVPGSAWFAIRATTTIPHVTKFSLRDFLVNDANMGGYDDMMDNVEPLLKVDDRTAIRRITFKAIWPTAPRDFVVCTTWSELDDGSLLISSRSAWDDLFPPPQGYVRGFLNISGFHITALPDCDAGCSITMCAHSDLGGSLPSGVVNMLSSSAPVKMLAAIAALTRNS
eukprot:CAMPEP_0185032022 /NCGR_PEP_ID=MMETSP1103-20130426/19837_1 /TAXON_ID=36769 /ORGANISM="Paraphysomonas bandaiensis, Strain Caron Lab Isolate" /LENGTH=928 /DNA_ID=CAMNT_0027567755 /DNA_START=314 /DNA_END=3100 /DNA_ORIENTATION=-